MAFKMNGAPFQKSALKHDGNHNGLSEEDHAKYSAAEKKGRGEHNANKSMAAVRAQMAAIKKRISAMSKKDGVTEEDMYPLLKERTRLAKLLTGALNTAAGN